MYEFFIQAACYRGGDCCEGPAEFVADIYLEATNESEVKQMMEAWRKGWEFGAPLGSTVLTYKVLGITDLRKD